MTTRLIGIGGDMASGKSYIAKYLLSPKKQRTQFRSITVERSPTRKLFIIGKYDDTRYPGTDFMYTPTLEHDVITFVTEIVAHRYPDHFTLFEGTRLFKPTFINTITRHPDIDCHLIMLQITESTSINRHLHRQDNQSLREIDNQHRRNLNLLERYNNLIHPMPNNTPEDFTAIIERITHYGNTYC